jgi:hypothetical protein
LLTLFVVMMYDSLPFIDLDPICGDAPSIFNIGETIDTVGLVGYMFYMTIPGTPIFLGRIFDCLIISPALCCYIVDDDAGCY